MNLGTKHQVSIVMPLTTILAVMHGMSTYYVDKSNDTIAASMAQFLVELADLFE